MTDDQREAIGGLHELGARFVAQKDKQAYESDWNGRKGRERPTLEQALAMDRPGLVPGSIGAVVIDIDEEGYAREVRELFYGQVFHEQQSSPETHPYKVHFYLKAPLDHDGDIKGGHFCIQGKKVGDIRATWGMVRVRDYAELLHYYNEFYDACDPIDLELLNGCRPLPTEPVRPPKPKPAHAKYSAEQVAAVVKNFAGDRDLKEEATGWRLGTRGSVSVTDEGDFYDHEAERGGGLADFVRASVGCTLPEALSKIDSLLGLNILAMPRASIPPVPIRADQASKDQHARDWQKWLDLEEVEPVLPKPRRSLWLPPREPDEELVRRIDDKTQTGHLYKDRDALRYLRSKVIVDGVHFRASAMDVEGDEVTTVVPRWFAWNEKERRWHPSTKEEVALWAMEMLDGHMYRLDPKSGPVKDDKKNGQIGYARQIVAMMAGTYPWRTPATAWDQLYLHIAHPDGSVTDLCTGIRRKQEADDLLRGCTGVVPAKTVRKNSPLLKWLKVNFPDPMVRECFLYHLSLCLAGYQFLDRMLFIEGAGGIGKTSVGEMLCEAMGSYARTLPDEIIVKGGDSYRGSSAQSHLQSVRLGVIKDLKKSATHIDSGAVNNLVGNRFISVRDIRGREANIEVCVTPLVIGNRIPGPLDPDSAMERRAIKFNLAGKTPGKDEQSKIRTLIMDPETQAEMLLMLIERFMAVVKRDRLPPVHPDVLAMTEGWIASGDDVLKALHKHAKKNPEGFVTVAQLAIWMSDDMEANIDTRMVGKAVKERGMKTGRKIVDGRDLTVVLGWKAR